MAPIQKALKLLPSEPGVYIYGNSTGTVIYIGKAKDLKNRVRQYFTRDDAIGTKTKQLVSEIHTIKTIPTTSEFDALLLEAKLIRLYLPKYNAALRDDKSPLYVAITLSEELPRMLLLRKGQIAAYESNSRNRIYGPFQSSFALRSLLRQLRTIVPYCTQKERRGRACFYTHLALCDPCPAAIVGMLGERKQVETRRYRRNIFRLGTLFEGKTRWLSQQYEKEMGEAARLQHFEQAALTRERLTRLKALSSYRYDPQVFLDKGAEDIYEEELLELRDAFLPYYPNLNALHRIECFDISNMMGTHAVGSMVVLTGGKPDKKEYRKFRIRSVRGISDVAMMKEVLTRRLKHAEWNSADFVLIDGGKPQVSAVSSIISAPFAGLAKREEELIITRPGGGFTVLRLPIQGRAIKVLQRIRDEAHRSAITYHRQLRDKIQTKTV